MKYLAGFTMLVSLAACGSKDPVMTQVTPPVDSVATIIPVAFAGGTVTARIAATAAKRDTGLMNVTQLATDTGMLFVYAGDQQSPPEGFWMKDTPIPLSIAFIDANKQVINIDDMQPETLTPHYATRPYRYALETAQGWLVAHGVAAGTTVAFTLPAGTVIDP